MPSGENGGLLSRIRRLVRVSWLSVLFVLDRALDLFMEDVRIIRREIELFLGTAFLFLGLLSFESDKYCDGNTADYLSCTRPATYYYFDALDVALIVLGTFLLLLWYLKRLRN